MITTASNRANNIRTHRIRNSGKQEWEEKEMYGYVKRYTGEISYEETWTWLFNPDLKIEMVSLLIAKNKAVGSYYVKV